MYIVGYVKPVKVEIVEEVKTNEEKVEEKTEETIEPKKRGRKPKKQD